MIPFEKEVFEWTKSLVQHPSIVGTIGERDFAMHLNEMLKQMPYFREHPNHLRIVPTRHDDKERYNVLALIKGKDGKRKETVLLMGHMDTVGVEDYGKWKQLAFSPDELLQEWKKSRIPASVQKDLDMSQYLPGRGVLDMKSGIAINLAVIDYFAKHREEWDGNLLFVAACDEEDNSRGILSALADLHQLAREEELEYVAAINSDYTAPRYDGDPHRYIYLGTVGKLLPAFYVVGKETHVGQAFEGFDPNLVIAELTSRIDYNTDLCDEMFGEVTLPPVSLKQTDLKKQYDVQTPQTAFCYFNFFVHSWSPKDVLNRLKELAQVSFEEAIRKFQTRRRMFCELSGHPYQPVEIEPRVYTYEEFYQRCKEEHGSEFEQKMLQYSMNLRNDDSLDIRDYARCMVEELWRWGGDSEPAVILFYASPYIPRVVLSEEDERDLRLMRAVEQAVADIEPQCDHPIQVRKFFPYISDMSFVKLSDDESEMLAFERNMPAWGIKHHIDLEAIRQLDVPVINIGPYGKDAHKKWERVEVPYSMQIAPNLTIGVIRHLFA